MKSTESPRLTLERMDDSPNPMVRLMFEGRALCAFYTSLGRLTALEAALDDSWADRILNQKDAAIAERNLLRSVAEALRVLVWLKDGPRDSAYDSLKVVAWASARSALAAANLPITEKQT